MRRLSKCALFLAVTWFLGGFFSSVEAQANLGSVAVGGSVSGTETVTLNVAGTIDRIDVVTKGAPHLDFLDSGTGTCKTGATYSQGQTCSIGVTFKPRSPGLIAGAAVVRSSTEILGRVFIHGSGTGPQLVFSPSKAVAFDPPVPSYGNTVGLVDPQSIAVDGQGTIYTNSASVEGLVIIPADGRTPYLQTALPTGAAFFGEVQSLVVDGAGDLFFHNGETTYEWLPDGSVKTFAESLFNDPFFKFMTESIAVDSEGNLFLGQNSFENGSRILEYKKADPQSTPVNTYILGPKGIIGNYGIEGIAVNAAGDLFVADRADGQLLELTAAQALEDYPDFISVPLSIGGKSIAPFALAFDGAGDLYISGDVTIAGTPSPVLVVRPASGAPVIALHPVVGGKAVGNPADSPSVEGLTLDSTGDLFIADSRNNRLVEAEQSSGPSLSFAVTPTGKKSTDSPQTVLVTNIGNMQLNISEVSFPTDFPKDPAVSHACAFSASLGNGQTCLLPVDFIPTTANQSPEKLVVEDNTLGITGTQQFVALTGYTPLLSSNSLSFGAQAIDTNSASQQVTLTNTTSAVLHIASISTSGASNAAFIFGNNCPPSLAAGASCSIHGHFRPVGTGAETATVTIRDSGPGSPQLIAVTGTGATAPAASYSATSLSYGSEQVGLASSSQQVLLTNTGKTPLKITGISVTGANASSFVFGSDCPASLPAGASCIIHGHFMPVTTGSLTAEVDVRTGQPVAPTAVHLSGTGSR